MRTFTVNVGINTSSKCLGRSAPIYANGTFDYIPIPSDDEDYQTYEELGYTSIFERMNIPHRLEEYVHHDPEFVSFTFGDYPTRSRTSCLKEIEYGDILLFIASLKRRKHERLGGNFQEWIVPNRGMYLIGMFEIIGILKSDGEPFRTKLGRDAYRNNAHYKHFAENPDDESWIFKGSGRSMLFPVGVPVCRPDLVGLYDVEPSATKQTETAQVSSFTRTAREVLNLEHLKAMLQERGIILPIGD